MIIMATETTQCKPVGRQRGKNDNVGTALRTGRPQGRQGEDEVQEQKDNAVRQ